MAMVDEAIDEGGGHDGIAKDVVPLLSQEASLQFGSFDIKRLTADISRGLNETMAVRATTLYENLKTTQVRHSFVRIV